MENSEKSRFFSPVSLSQIEMACNNARIYANLLATDRAALAKFRVAFQDDAKSYVELEAANDATLVASHTTFQARAKLASFIRDFRSPSGFLMNQEELTLGLNLTMEWLDMAVRVREFGALKDIIQTAIDNTVGQLGLVVGFFFTGFDVILRCNTNENYM